MPSRIDNLPPRLTPRGLTIGAPGGGVSRDYIPEEMAAWVIGKAKPPRRRHFQDAATFRHEVPLRIGQRIAGAPNAG